jgi:MFS superfamily sulfate permease-like transporter
VLSFAVILEENEPEDASDGVYRTTTDEEEEITVEFEPEEGDNNRGFVNKVKSCFSNTVDYVQNKKNSLQNRKDFHLKERLKYYIPILDWLPQYKFLNLKGDFIAGLTVGVMLVPQSLAYSILAGLPPIYALQTAFYPIIIYVLLGTSKHLSVGPEAIITILVGETLDELASTAEERASIACSLALLVGSFTCLLGFFRFGFLAHIFSRPLLCGFINAVAFEIIMEQLDKFFGLEATKAHGFYKISIILDSISEMHLLSLLMGIACLAVLLAIRFLKKRLINTHVAIQYIPDILIVVVLSTAITRIARLDEHGLKLLGNIEAGLLPPKFPTLLDDLNFSGLSATASSALTISMIGFVESILIATTYADKHSYTISANRELVALGTLHTVILMLSTIRNV